MRARVRVSNAHCQRHNSVLYIAALTPGRDVSDCRSELSHILLAEPCDEHLPAHAKSEFVVTISSYSAVIRDFFLGWDRLCMLFSVLV